MTLKEQRLTTVLMSRGMAAAIALIALVGALIAAGRGVTAIPGLKGIGLPSPNHWADSVAASARTALIVMAVSMAGMVLINRIFNLLRTLSLLYAALFVLMAGAVPMCMCQFYGGTLLVPVLLGAMWAMFGAFNDMNATRRVFLAFAMVTAGAMCQYGFIVYLPVLAMGCAQMRIFSLRTMTAALIGIATPVWIAWGFGIADFSTYGHPGFTTIFTTAARPQIVQFLVAAGVTALLLIALTLLNLIKIYSYNLKTRAMNGLLITVSAATLLMMGLDFTNMPFYYPMLCCATAFQAGHFLAINRNRRSCYIMAASIIVVYTGLWVWWMYQ